MLRRSKALLSGVEIPMYKNRLPERAMPDRDLPKVGNKRLDLHWRCNSHALGQS